MIGDSFVNNVSCLMLINFIVAQLEIAMYSCTICHCAVLDTRTCVKNLSSSLLSVHFSFEGRQKLQAGQALKNKSVFSLLWS
jgi:uncharacterized membrane protein